MTKLYKNLSMQALSKRNSNTDQDFESKIELVREINKTNKKKFMKKNMLQIKNLRMNL